MIFQTTNGILDYHLIKQLTNQIINLSQQNKANKRKKIMVHFIHSKKPYGLNTLDLTKPRGSTPTINFITKTHYIRESHLPPMDIDVSTRTVSSMSSVSDCDDEPSIVRHAPDEERRHSILKVKTQRKSINEGKNKRRSSICQLTRSFFAKSNDEKIPSNITKQRLRFGFVECREYDITVSDNPASKSGASVELGWNYNVKKSVHIDTFEEIRRPQRATDFQNDKRLTKHERERLLREFGVTDLQIQQAAKSAAIIRNQRKKSIQTIQHDKLHEKFEDSMARVKSSLQRILRSKPKSDAAEDRQIIRRASAMLAIMDYEEDKNSGILKKKRAVEGDGILKM